MGPLTGAEAYLSPPVAAVDGSWNPAASPAVSIILVNYNTRERLLRGLDRLASLGGPPSEVIVVDNASTDGSPDAARTHRLGPRVLVQPVNAGFAAGVNAGVAASRGRYVALVNSDALLDPGALEALISHIEENPRVGAAGGRVVNPDRTLQPTAFSEPGLLDSWLEFGFLGRRRPFGIHPAPERTGAVDWVSGAFLVIPRTVVERVGGFDERYFLYAEDVDWCRRVRAAGYEVHYVTSGSAVHEGRGSDPEAGGWSPRAVAARLQFHAKHRGRPAAFLLRAALSLNWIVTLAALLPASLLPGNVGRRARRAAPRVLGLIRNAGDSRPRDHHVALIAIVDFPNGVGGDTRRVHMLARSLVAAGIRTHLVIPCPRGLVRDEHTSRQTETIDGIEVIRLSRQGSYGHDPSLGALGTIRLFLLRWATLFRSLPVLARLRDRGLTALYLYQPTFYDGLTYWLAARFLGLKIVADYCDLSFIGHDRIERSFARRLWALNYLWGLTWLPRRLDRTFVISRYLEDFMKYRTRPGRLVRVPPVVDTVQFDLEPPPGFLASRHGITQPGVILYAGSFFDNEGVPVLLQAVPEVLKRHPEATFLVVGGHPAEALEHLKQQARDLGVGEKVIFAGVAPSLEMPLYFRSADILVAPKSENILNRAGVPTKLVEYLASGRPVVSTTVGDIPELVVSGEEALLVEPDDPAAMAGALSELLRDPERARAIGERGRIRVRRDFDVISTGRRLRMELEAIGSGRQAGRQRREVQAT